MQRGLILAIVAGVLLALFPVIVDVIDAYYSSTSAAGIESIIPPTTGNATNLSGLIVSVPEVVSKGTDTLIVRPGEVYVEPGTEFNVTIIVLFEHAQPCPSPTWKVYYNVSGGVEVLADDGGQLVNSKTYVRILTVKASGNGTVDVVFKYGETCPYTTKEKEEVQVKIYVVENLGAVASNITVANTTTTPLEELVNASEEEHEYFNISGVIEYIDYAYRVIVVNNTTIEVRGSWLSSEGYSLSSKYLLEALHVGDRVVVECYKTEEGVVRANKIIVDGVVYTRSGE